jgi:hypothetical protein
VFVRAVIALLYAVIALMSVVINRICAVIAITIAVIITPTKVIDKIAPIAKSSHCSLCLAYINPVGLYWTDQSWVLMFS